MNITKEQATIMRGWAIMFIALHNFFHLEAFGLPQENETVFSIDRTADFFLQLFSENSHVVGILFSFIGWCGVPVFVLLSGYGLSKKYERSEGKINEWTYIKYNYLKLLCLIFPAAIFFLTYRVIEGSWNTAIKGLLSLTFLNTFVPGYGSIAPPFWYFSLTFQLYLAYLLLCRVKNWKVLTAIGLVFLSLYIVVGPDLFQSDFLLKRMRLTLFGWIPVFVIGMLLARKKSSTDSPKMSPPSLRIRGGECLALAVYILISFVVLVLVNKNYYLWVMMPFVAIIFFYCITLLVEKLPLINNLTLWVGNYSSYIFVSHPIALLLIEHSFGKTLMSLPLNLLAFVYIALFLSISFMYKFFHLSIVKLIDLK